FVALHPGDVPGWEVENLVRPDDDLLALVGPDAHSPAEDNAPVVELARGGADLGLCVRLPAPPRLQDMVADHRSGEAHLVGRTQRIRDHRLGLAPSAGGGPPHASPP